MMNPLDFGFLEKFPEKPFTLLPDLWPGQEDSYP
jgi:hypothetical protein